MSKRDTVETFAHDLRPGDRFVYVSWNGDVREPVTVLDSKMLDEDEDSGEYVYRLTLESDWHTFTANALEGDVVHVDFPRPRKRRQRKAS